MNLQEKIWKNYLIICKINYASSSEKLKVNDILQTCRNEILIFESSNAII